MNKEHYKRCSLYISFLEYDDSDTVLYILCSAYVDIAFNDVKRYCNLIVIINVIWKHLLESKGKSSKIIYLINLHMQFSETKRNGALVQRNECIRGHIESISSQISITFCGYTYLNDMLFKPNTKHRLLTNYNNIE